MGTAQAESVRGAGYATAEAEKAGAPRRRGGGCKHDVRGVRRRKYLVTEPPRGHTRVDASIAGTLSTTIVWECAYVSTGLSSSAWLGCRPDPRVDSRIRSYQPDFSYCVKSSLMSSTSTCAYATPHRPMAGGLAALAILFLSTTATTAAPPKASTSVEDAARAFFSGPDASAGEGGGEAGA